MFALSAGFVPFGILTRAGGFRTYKKHAPSGVNSFSLLSTLTRAEMYIVSPAPLCYNSNVAAPVSGCVGWL